ncbi:MAG: NOB1 family endonuclease [Methanomassiliicoccales archaeon]
MPPSLTVRLVVDTSALFHLERLPEGAEIFAPHGVLRELERYGDVRSAYLSELITVMEPGREALRVVEEGAQRTGDQVRLSEVDRRILALAWELGARIMTDDYSVQNLASELGLEYLTAGEEGISAVWRWRYRCVGCGRVWKECHPDCPVCGSRLKSHRKG